MDDMKLLTLLLKAIHAEWPMDRTRPGLVLSYLAKDGKFYASIVRYKATGKEYWEHEKQVVMARQAATAEEALRQLAADFTGASNAKEELKGLLRG